MKTVYIKCTMRDGSSGFVANVRRSMFGVDIELTQQQNRALPFVSASGSVVLELIESLGQYHAIELVEG